MILGDGEYANADYWKWRSTAPTLCPRLWSVNVHMGHEAVSDLALESSSVVDASQLSQVLRVQCFADQPAINDSVYVIDCIWEYYVLVGGEARGNRQDIRLALSTASVRAYKLPSGRLFIVSAPGDVEEDFLIETIFSYGPCLDIAFTDTNGFTAEFPRS